MALFRDLFLLFRFPLSVREQFCSSSFLPSNKPTSVSASSPMARTVSSTAFAIFVLTLVSFTSASSLLSSLDLTNLAVRNFTPTEVGVAYNGLVDITDGAANWQKGDLFYCKETCGDFLMSYAVSTVLLPETVIITFSPSCSRRVIEEAQSSPLNFRKFRAGLHLPGTN